MKTWNSVINYNTPLILPVAHDALTARIIERMGFPAYQIGGFALSGTMHAVPDIGLEQFGEKKKEVEDIMSASSLPVMVDADDGYGDVKSVTRTIKEYIKLGVKAVFIEDQKPPKKCGHMSEQHVIPPSEMENKIKAAVDAIQNEDLFLLARTDAISSEGVEGAIRRAHKYYTAGADGVYIEGITSKQDLKTIGKEFSDVILATSILENGGKTPWVHPQILVNMGYSIILYPTSVIFTVTKAIQRSLARLKSGREISSKSVDMDEFENIVNISYWKDIEEKFK